MLDATNLALALIEHGTDIETALTQYEAAMFPGRGRGGSLRRRARHVLAADARKASSNSSAR